MQKNYFIDKDIHFQVDTGDFTYAATSYIKKKFSLFISKVYDILWMQFYSS